MKNKNWRDVAEIVGIVSIVAGLILVAWEVRQANNIATTHWIVNTILGAVTICHLRRAHWIALSTPTV
jgi:CHASE2 domain-containing sensor protein